MELQPHPTAGDQSKSWLRYSISLGRKKQLSTISVTFSLCCRKKKREKKIHTNSCTNYFKWAHPNFCAGCRAKGQPHSAARAACSRAAKSRAPLTPLPPPVNVQFSPLEISRELCPGLWWIPWEQGGSAPWLNGVLFPREAWWHPNGAALDNLTGKQARNRKCNQLSVMRRSRWGEEA